MRFLGIDYGTKRIGIAVSDENNTLAFPKEIVFNDADTIKRLSDIIKNENIGEIVIGESVDFSGKLNALSGRIEVFILELKEKFKLPVNKQKEFLTSVEARKSKNGKKEMSPSQAHSKVKQIKSGRVDASAAALILQRYLDRRSREHEGQKTMENKNQINIEDFRKIDIVVGKILSAEKIPETDKLLKLSVDLGEVAPRQIVSGISLYFPDCSLLVGKKCMFVANLEPRVIRGIESQGMILAVSTEDDLPAQAGKFSLLEPNDEIPVSTRAK